MLVLKQSYDRRNSFDHLFNRVLHDWPVSGVTKNSDLRPLTDVTERDDAFSFVIDLPGVKKEGIEIKISEGILSVIAEKKQIDSDDEQKTKLKERYSGRYQRSFELPDTVDEDKVEAKFEDGVLSLELFKHPEKTPSTKLVAIQ